MIALDLSRLLSRAGRAAPTGIDRVELAFAEHLIARGTARLFTALTPDGRLAPLPRPLAEAYVGAIGAAWRAPQGRGEWRRARRLAARARLTLLAASERLLCARLRASPGSVYLLVSHHHLDKDRLIARLKRRGRIRFVCLIHDLIPIEFPEYARPGQAARHRRRIATAAALADAVIVNSTATGAALRPHLERAGRTIPMLTAPFGAELRVAATTAPPPSARERPYFVCLGTIEPRKNHLLLLDLWRELSRDLGARAPLLVLVGRRGWEIGNVVAMLDRCPVLRGSVVEHNALPDAAMAALLRGARALLLPSFAEGFGLPVVEALRLGVPVLCSDLAALRESGGIVPDFLDPLDGPGWRRAILDYAAPGSPRRAAQLARLAAWRAPHWDDYFATVDRFIADIAAGNLDAETSPRRR